MQLALHIGLVYLECYTSLVEHLCKQEKPPIKTECQRDQEKMKFNIYYLIVCC